MGLGQREKLPNYQIMWDNLNKKILDSNEDGNFFHFMNLFLLFSNQYSSSHIMNIPIQIGLADFLLEPNIELRSLILLTLYLPDALLRKQKPYLLTQQQYLTLTISHCRLA